jgi:hypothetical protein
MSENGKKTVSRRKLLGGMGKLAYVAPTLTFLSVVTNGAQAASPPCPPNNPGCKDGGAPQQQNPRVKKRTKPKK